MKDCQCIRQVISGQEYAALQHYIHRLESCVRKDFSSGAAHWLGRIHELEAKIDQRGEDAEQGKVGACDGLASATADLYEALEDRLAQTKCGCGHPACKRCKDDAEAERVLSKARGE